MNTPFSTALTVGEPRRTVPSTKFNDSFREILTTITGDDMFRVWKISALSLWKDSNVDLSQMVHRRELIREHAQSQFVKLAGGEFPRDTPVTFD